MTVIGTDEFLLVRMETTTSINTTVIIPLQMDKLRQFGKIVTIISILVME